jgi:hypothetical protein
LPLIVNIQQYQYHFVEFKYIAFLLTSPFAQNMKSLDGRRR